MILRHYLTTVLAGTLLIATDCAVARESPAGNRLLLVMPLNMTSWHSVAPDTYPILCVILNIPSHCRQLTQMRSERLQQPGSRRGLSRWRSVQNDMG